MFWKRIAIGCISLSVFMEVSQVCAQGTPVVPPPRPSDEPDASAQRPTLEETVQFVQNKLKEQGQVAWEVLIVEPVEGTTPVTDDQSWLLGPINFNTNGRCDVSLTYSVTMDSTNEFSRQSRTQFSWSSDFALADVEKLDVRSHIEVQRADAPIDANVTVRPDVFDLTLYAATGKHFLSSWKQTYPLIAAETGIGLKILSKYALKKNDAKKGVLIASLVPGGPAERASLKVGDIIISFGTLTFDKDFIFTSVDGSILASQYNKLASTLQTYLERLNPGADVPVSYFRDGKPMTTTITLGRSSESMGEAKQISLVVQNEETADRIAKAITHAVGLCGGGSKEAF